MNYNFLLPSPFEGGLVWITLPQKGGHRTVLYDIEQKKVLGELLDGWPIFGNRDQSKVLLAGHSKSFREKFFELLQLISGGKIKLGQRDREERFEVFDLKENRAIPGGTIYQVPGAGSRWYPSPTFRYGYTCPTAGAGSDVFLCDLDKGQTRKITIQGITAGWWNENSILYKSKNHDFALYDVTKEQSSILLPASDIEAFLKTNQLGADLSANNLRPFPEWDGKQYQFYFTDTHKRWEATNFFLAKIERPSGNLKLIDADFKFEWSDGFDPTGRYYVFSGREFSDGDSVSAVYLRDLQTGETRTLAADIGVNQHSIPRWYGNGAIYSRSNKLWRVDLSGTNVAQLFPPTEQ